jgi:hypothetical protein
VNLRVGTVVTAGVIVMTAAITLLTIPGPTEAQDDAPVVTYISPAEGDVISAPAFAIQMCFAEPVNIRDLPDNGDFSFQVTPPEPDSFPLGSRIVFQPDAYGVAVYANNADADTPNGEWTFSYRVTNPDTLTPTEGEVHYVVDPDGEELPQATPPSCEPGSTPNPQDQSSPVNTDDGGNGGDDDGDINLLIVLIAVGVVALLVVAAGVLMVRRRTNS